MATADVYNTVALSIGGWLADSQINLSRQLKHDEPLGMAWVAIGTYNDLRVQRAQELENAPDPRQLILPGIGAV